MPRIRVVLAVVMTAASVALALTGCASTPAPLPPTATVAEISCAGMDPFGGDAQPAAGPVPDDFEPVAAVRCVPFHTIEDDEGIWSVVLRERLEGDLAAVLRAQAEPDDPRWLGACAAIETITPLVWLTDAAGRGVRLRYPVDGCGQPKVELIGDALAELTVVRTDEEQRPLAQPRAAIDAGCAPTWAARPLRLAPAEELESWQGTGAVPQPSPTSDGMTLVPWEPPRPPAPGEVDEMRLCAYSTDESANPTTTPAPGATTWISIDVDGQAWFTGSRVLDDAATRAVLEAAASAQPLPHPCDDIPGSLVVLHSGEGRATITVELDGCRRLIVDHLSTYAAPAELVELLHG